MAKFTQHTNGSVVEVATGHRVGWVLSPQGVKGINGAAFYTLAQMKGGTLVRPEQTTKGAVIGRRSLDDVVAAALENPDNG